MERSNDPTAFSDGLPEVFLGLGSNLGPRQRNIDSALLALNRRRITPLTLSSLYETEPVGEKNQPTFLNCACRVAGEMTPHLLLENCLAVEGELGRIRRGRWGPRLIDIDILFYGQLIVSSRELKLPHPRLHRRRFVLVPLAEIAPHFRDPRSGLSVEQLLGRCSDTSRVIPLRRPEWKPGACGSRFLFSSSPLIQ